MGAPALEDSAGGAEGTVLDIECRDSRLGCPAERSSASYRRSFRALRFCSMELRWITAAAAV
jgi:hypothetical protein